MKQLTELNSTTHRDLRVVENSPLICASGQHVMQLRASEIGKAVSCFPVFASRSPSTGDWALSAVTSFEQGVNLFVEDDGFTATYEPDGMRTYPLFLMQSPNDTKSYVVGIDEHSDALSPEVGEALYDQRGQPSIFLNKMIAMLEASAQNDIQTHMFMQRLEQLQLLKSINLNVHFENDNVQTITGLHTIDEDRLQALPANQLEELNKNGYLLLANAMLVSIFQLNLLIRKHNRSGGGNPVRSVKLAVARDSAAADAAL